MQIEISGSVLKRLSNVGQNVPQNESRTWLKSVFVQRRGGHAWAGSTDSRFAAVEYLGVSPGDDGFLVLQCAEWNEGPVAILDMPELNWCSVAVIRDPEAIATLQNWRNWFPTEAPTQPGKPMYLDVDGMASLVASSPSGRVVFPKIIDAEKPVFISDVAEPNWRGVFFAQGANGVFINGATLPEWIK